MGTLKLLETVLKAVSALASSGLSFIKFIGIVCKIVV